MSGLTLHPESVEREKADLASEIAETTVLLDDRKLELANLQTEFREFKERYARIVGGRLAELAEVEQALREAEERIHGIENASEETEPVEEERPVQPKQTSLRKLFWSVARLFHPDHATDDLEARRRHTVMAQATRAYSEGDFESLETLLGDDELRFYCTTGSQKELGLAEQLWALKDELRTIEFGIKRIKQDPLYIQKLSADALAAEGRDALTQLAETISRKIVKARNRLQHFS
jgi:hypothetical protein